MCLCVCALGILGVEVREAGKHPTMHKTAPQQSITRPQMSVVPRSTRYYEQRNAIRRRGKEA